MTSPGKFCENCGTALDAGSRFCEKCGRPVGAASVVSMLQAAATCPACGKGDRIVTASAYQEATDPEVPGDTDRVPPSMVASFIARPDKPVAVGVFAWAIAPLIPMFLFFIYWFAPIGRTFKIFLFGCTIAFVASVLVPALYDMQLYPFIGIFHLLFYWVALLIGRDQYKIEFLTKRLPQYNATLARWDHLQYCTGCQKAWLDNASAAPVDIIDVGSLLTL